MVLHQKGREEPGSCTGQEERKSYTGQGELGSGIHSSDGQILSITEKADEGAHKKRHTDSAAQEAPEQEEQECLVVK